jgi:hypothetical protein
MSSPAQAHWSEFIFKIFGKGSAVVEGKVIANEGKVIAQEVKVIDDSAGAFDDVINWFKRLFGIPVDTKLENEFTLDAHNVKNTSFTSSMSLNNMKPTNTSNTNTKNLADSLMNKNLADLDFNTFNTSSGGVRS